MTAQFINAAPTTNMQGIQDKSARTLVPVVEALPTHLPKIYIFAQKGTTLPQLVDGEARNRIYGADSFDMRKPWANHATDLCNVLIAAPNSVMAQRVKPADAKTATLRVYLDVLPTKVQDFQRNLDGSIKKDAITGLPVPVTGPGASIDGYKVKFVVEEVLALTEASLTPEDTFGAGVVKAGDQTDATTSTQSQKIPFMDLEVDSFGAYGSNTGLRIWAPTAVSAGAVDGRILTNEKVYPYRIACMQRDSALTTPKVLSTLGGEQYVDFSLKEGVINRTVDKQMFIGDVFLQAYEKKNDPKYAPVFGPFGRFHLYQANVAAFLEDFYAAELPHNGLFGDFKGTPTVPVADEEHLFNIFGGVSSAGVPYHSYQILSGAGTVRFTESATVYARGGADGTMTNAVFDALVSAEVLEYANPLSVLQDMAKYPEAIIYDSGFGLQTKYDLMSVMALRKDIAVALTTFTVGGKTLTASEDSALALALRTRARNYPESEFYGTSTCRCVIVARSGKRISSQFTKPLPLIIEFAAKAARFMGASNGKWKSVYGMDQDPNNLVADFTDVSVTFTPLTVRNGDWANGLIWVEHMGRQSLYFPAFKTVYDDDTSVLNSFITMMACVELQKVGDRARRKYSGNSKLTAGQLIERVNEYVVENTVGRFDDRFIIQPNTYYTAADIARGYSYTLAIKIGAPNMTTVGSLTIESYRYEDLATS
jgi:hypothetical protein